MSVSELSNALDMSYMGVKQHCLELEELGYLDTWRRPKPIGRPELVYRLTHKAHELFPEASNSMTIELLESSQALYGTSAPEKLLYLVFQRKTAEYLERVKGEDGPERAKWFARLRDAEGYMAELENDENGMRIVEHHSPIAGLLNTYPALIGRLEQELFSKVLKTPVKREQTNVSGLYCCEFRIDFGTRISDFGKKPPE
jgi:predicted ArsR family transcriptional regulator